MLYNEVLKEVSELCVSDNGIFCTEWEVTSVTTYPFDTLILLGQFALFLLVINWFRNR